MAKPRCNCKIKRACIELETSLRADEMHTYRVTRCMGCHKVRELIDWSYRVEPFVDSTAPEIMLRCYDDMLIHGGVRLTHAMATCHEDVEAIREYLIGCTVRVQWILCQQGVL